MSKDDIAKLDEQLDRSLKNLEALLNDPNHRGSGERLDTSKTERVAADMQVKLRELQALSQESQQRFAAARERHERIKKLTNTASILIYAGLVVWAVWYFFF